MNKWFLLNFLIFANITIERQCVNANAAIITSVNYAFETFSPYALIRFFEFSDKEWNITEKCFRDMYVYVNSLRSGEYWAVKLYDASSYYAGAAFSGTSLRLHNPNVCRLLSKQFNEYFKVPRHHSETLLYVLPFDVHLISGHFLMEIAHDNFFRFEKIQQMICFPKSCTNTDMETILDVYLFQTTIFVRNITYLSHRIVTDNYKIYEDFNFYILIIILCGSVLIHLTVFIARHYIVELNRSTLSEEYMKKHAVGSFKVNSLKNIAEWKNTLEGVDMKQFTMRHFETNKKESLPKILSRQHSYCFEELLDYVSLPNVIYNLLQTSSTPLCGLIFMFSFFFIWLHLVAEYSFMANNMDLDLSNNKVKQRVALMQRSAYIMDAYFLINGANSSYDFFKSLPKDKLNVFEQLKHVCKLVVKKLFGLMPSYTFVLYSAQVLDKYFHHNVILELPSRDYKNCAQNTDCLCMPWTWFISLQVQFYVTSCLLMLLVEIQLRYSIIIGTTIFCISIAAATLWSLGPIYEYGYTTSLLYELVNFNLILDNICLFIIPHLLGICLGHIIYKMNHNFNINIFFVVSGWLFSITLIAFYIFGLNVILHHVSKLTKAILIVTTHIIWCCILFWTVISAMSNNGDIIYKILSFKYAHVFEKLTPINLIITPIIIRLLIFTADVPIYWSTGQTLAVFIGCFLLINVSSLLLYILLDGPLMAALENLLGNSL
ncbi:Nose resistant to fluoxetine protein 6 [Lucilia cuprina]|nr:Nose resistant to fluoxetine protein 6 [Lucilia cuprina]